MNYKDLQFFRDVALFIVLIALFCAVIFNNIKTFATLSLYGMIPVIILTILYEIEYNKDLRKRYMRY